MFTNSERRGLEICGQLNKCQQEKLLQITQLCKTLKKKLRYQNIR